MAIENYNGLDLIASDSKIRLGYLLQVNSSFFSKMPQNAVLDNIVRRHGLFTELENFGW